MIYGIVLYVGAIVVSAVDPRDLQRARAKVPRKEWKGTNPSGMGDTLNGHLLKMFPNTKPCHEWSAEELQNYQAQLYDFKYEDFDKIYATTYDNRRMRLDSLDSHEKHWNKVNALVSQHGHLKEMHRDGHCHEAVMWLVHHVPAADQQTVFAKVAAPLLPSKRHSCGPNVTEAESEICKVYEGMYSCADCHSNSGIIAQDYSDLDGKIPEDPAHPGWAIQRRCDQNYMPACGPCDGIGGPYWGDSVKKFQPTSCEVVALPEAVPVAERQTPEFAEQFIVHQLGSDRLARTQNAARFAIYSQVRSTLWYDFPLGGQSNGTATDGMAKLRHDTYYDDLGYKWLDNGLVSEVHLQSREQRENNITGPMVSLIHGLLGYGKYLGGLTCLADPVGVPVLAGKVNVKNLAHSSFTMGADYKGRIKIGVEYDGFKLGDKGNGDMTKKRIMTVDHYVKWFLHLFVDADKASPTFGQPVRFYGPYSGFAVYISFNKTVPPPEVYETACVGALNGWPTSEKKPLHPCEGKKITDFPCMVVEKNHPEVCKPWASSSSGDLQEAPLEFERFSGAFGSVHIPKQSQQPTYV